MEDFVPPHSLEAEMSALGSMFMSEKAAEEVRGLLDFDDFYHPAHREVFKAVLQTLRNNQPIDIVTVRDELSTREKLEEVGGVEYLMQLVDAVPSASNANHYANIVLDRATQRRMLDASHDIAALVFDPDRSVREKLDVAEHLVFAIGQKRARREFVPVKTLAKEFFVDVDELVAGGEPMLGAATGFHDLDALTTGFYPGDLVIVAARPGMGKTSLVINFALNMASHCQGAVAIFSLEMQGLQLVRRMISSLAKVEMKAMKTSPLSDSNYAKLANACEQLYNMPVFIDDSSDISPLDLRQKCRRLKAAHGLSLIVVDYLQLMRGSSNRPESRVQEITEIARGLKALAKDLDTPVIALSQLNRGVEGRPDKRPQLSDLRDSGSIEAEADMVLFIYRDSYYERNRSEYSESSVNSNFAEAVELNVAKHRNGPTGTVLIGFQPSYTRFMLLDEESKRKYWSLVKEKQKKLDKSERFSGDR